jgi:mRNA interferase MazF
MPSYAKHDVILVRYPFSDLSSSKVRPAVVVSTSHPSQDILITPLTSKTGSFLLEEFVLSEWAASGLNVATAVKRGVYTVHESLVIKVIGQLVHADAEKLEQSLRGWRGRGQMC